MDDVADGLHSLSLQDGVVVSFDDMDGDFSVTDLQQDKENFSTFGFYKEISVILV